MTFERASAPVSDGASGVAGAGPPVTVRLRLLATSDLHMHLEAYDYYTDEACPRKGLALTATLIAQARAEVPSSILFDNGDFLQGSPLGDYVAAFSLRPNPMIQAMNHLGYDVANLGNHEFSHGIDALEEAVAEARFPCISANTQRAGPPGTEQSFVPPVALIERSLPDQNGREHRIRIGVIGVLPPQTAVWDNQAIAGRVQMVPMVRAVANQVPRLRASGADLVVVLAHCGIGVPDSPPEADNAGLSIAQIDGVDALILGHVHLPFPGEEIPPSPGVDPVAGTLAGKPVVMPGFFGSHLGVIDLDLAQSGRGWRISGHTCEARPIAQRNRAGHSVATVTPDPAISNLIEPAHRAAVDWARRPIGLTDRPIHSYFSMITDSLDVQLVNRAQADYVAARLKGGWQDGIPILAASAPFKAGGRAGPENFSFIPKGSILLRNAADLYIHPNTIVALRLTGADLRGWLERSASVFRQVIPGQQDQILLDPDMPSFHFDTIRGLSYEIDLSVAPGDPQVHRVRNIRWQGRPLQDGDPFILATNSYRSSGSGAFLRPDATRIVLADQKSNSDILIAYLARMTDLTPLETDAPAWRFAAMPGTSVVFETAPDSMHHRGDVAHLALQPLGMTSRGFQQYRLNL